MAALAAPGASRAAFPVFVFLSNLVDLRSKRLSTDYADYLYKASTCSQHTAGPELILTHIKRVQKAIAVLCRASCCNMTCRAVRRPKFSCLAAGVLMSCLRLIIVLCPLMTCPGHYTWLAPCHLCHIEIAVHDRRSILQLQGQLRHSTAPRVSTCKASSPGTPDAWPQHMHSSWTRLACRAGGAEHRGRPPRGTHRSPPEQAADAAALPGIGLPGCCCSCRPAARQLLCQLPGCPHRLHRHPAGGLFHRCCAGPGAPEAVILVNLCWLHVMRPLG